MLLSKSSIALFRTGTEVRIWRLILSHRLKYKTYHNELTQIHHQRPSNECLITNGFTTVSPTPPTSSNYNSYDSNSNNTASDYETCSGCEDKE